MDFRPLAAWVNERHAIYIRKSLRAGLAPEELHVPDVHEGGWDLEDADPQMLATFADPCPLSDDPIFQQYRCCNVFRELDRVTQWIDRNIRQPFKDHPDLWMMLAIARTINWPETLQFIMNRHSVKCDYNAWPNKDGYDLPAFQARFGFDPEQLGRALDHWSKLGNKVYTGAYMIRAESNPKAEWYSWTKQRYIAEIVLGRLWEDRADWMAYLTTDDPNNQLLTLKDVWERFQDPRYIGWGPFMAYQVVVDLRHTRYLRGAHDIQEWSALGPGSRRGLNRLAGRPVDYPLKQEEGLIEMQDLHRNQDKWRAPWVPPIDLSDIQNCLCEVDKYLRVKNGEGKPRAKYVAGRGW